MAGLLGAAASPPTATAAPRGILKTQGAVAAKRHAERQRHLDASRNAIMLKVLLLGGDGVVSASSPCRMHATSQRRVRRSPRGAPTSQGKSSIIRCLTGERQPDSYEATGSISTATLLAAAYEGRPVFLQLWEVSFSAYIARQRSRLAAARRSGGAAAEAADVHLDIVFQGAHAALLVMDATDAAAALLSLRALDACRDEVRMRLRVHALDCQGAAALSCAPRAAAVAAPHRWSEDWCGR